MQSDRSKPRFAACLTIVVCALTAVGALASFGPQFWGRGSWTDPFTWNAPTLTMARSKALEKESSRAASAPVRNPDGEVVVLDDWNYTAIVRGRPQPSRLH